MLSRRAAARAALRAPALQLGSRGGTVHAIMSTLASAGTKPVVSAAPQSAALLPHLAGVARTSSAAGTGHIRLTLIAGIARAPASLFLQTRLFPARASLTLGAASMASKAALTKTVFVKTESAPDWTALVVSADLPLALLKEEAAKKLQLTERLDKLTLHLDTAGSLGDAVDSRKKLGALLDGKEDISLVIKGAAPAVPADPAGE